MFSDLNEKIQVVKEDLRKKKKYEERIQHATLFLQEEERKRDDLKRQLLKEEEDVARLEGFSFANIFYTITGQKLEKLDKEEQEVLAAKLKYKESMETIADIEKEIKQYREKLEPVANAEFQYRKIIQMKEQLIHDKNSYWSQELFALAEQEAEISSNMREYEEAIIAGKEALTALNQALKSLDSAKGWSTFDMLGGGMLSTAVKHSHIDDAKVQIHQVQQRLRHFQEELSDIENHFKAKVEIGGLLTFADYFFDGFIFDWFVHGKISDSLEQTAKTKQDVSKLLVRLKEQRTNLNNELAIIKKKRIEILESAN